MTILIDELTDYPGKGAWCHMVSDLGGAAGLAELHAFARELNLDPAWFQNRPQGDHPHYDLRRGKRSHAAKLARAGANVRFVSSAELAQALFAKYPDVITDEQLWAWVKAEGVHQVDDPQTMRLIKGVRVITVQKASGGFLGRGPNLRHACLSLLVGERNRATVAAQESTNAPAQQSFFCKR